MTIGNESDDSTCFALADDLRSKKTYHEGFFLSERSAQEKKRQLQDLMKETEDLTIEIVPRKTQDGDNVEYWAVIMQMKANGSSGENDWGTLKVLSYFEDFELAKEFYDMKMKQLEVCDTKPTFTFRLINGRMHDSAFVRVVNGKILQ